MLIIYLSTYGESCKAPEGERTRQYPSRAGGEENALRTFIHFAPRPCIRILGCWEGGCSPTEPPLPIRPAQPFSCLVTWKATMADMVSGKDTYLRLCKFPSAQPTLN